MAFSSITFLFYFLPAFLIVYSLLPGIVAKNLFLVAASLLFYAWGAPVYLPLLVILVFVNYCFALVIDATSPEWRTVTTALGVALNLIVLGVFKYLDFVIQSANAVFAPSVPLRGTGLLLPLGLSFIVFHAISYLVDIHRGKVKATRNPLDTAVYLTMFPQLVAGPIIRYHAIARRIRARRHSLGRASAGMRIFILGLAQKVLVADEVARIAEAAFDQTASPTFVEVWLGVVAYTLQIYFDFAGYSNMAIGLAVVLGFSFPRNFRLPYISCSVTEFWRRWHITLSAWFRDYVYIPLGGNRGSDVTTYRNLSIVFLLCGLWHGANWTFVVWGLHHGCFLIAERAGLESLLARVPAPVARTYTLLAVMTGWVWFRSPDFARASDMFAGMIGLNGLAPMSVPTHLSLYPTTVGAMAVGALLALDLLPGPAIPPAWLRRLAGTPVAIVDTAAVGVLFALSCLAVAANSYSPFLYFRF
jgi:D-alanyl-lipoteichoic acid acyltransferase DltB (MBOAT superfamily)